MSLNLFFCVMYFKLSKLSIKQLCNSSLQSVSVLMFNCLIVFRAFNHASSTISTPLLHSIAHYVKQVCWNLSKKSKFCLVFLSIFLLTLFVFFDIVCSVVLLLRSWVHRLVVQLLFLAIQLLIRAPNFRKMVRCKYKRRRCHMEKYIGIGFVILCLAVLAGVVGILGYQFHADKEKVDISPAKANINQSNNNSTVE